MRKVATASLCVTVYDGVPDAKLLCRWNSLCEKTGEMSPSRRLEWLCIFHDALKHEPIVLEAKAGVETVGILPMVHMQSRLFGRFLVGLPYLNVGGVLSTGVDVSSVLLERAFQLADELDVKHL